MTTALELDQLQDRLRQMLPDLGIASVLSELKKVLPEQTVKFNSVFQLETRLNAVNKDRIRGLLTQQELDVAYNKISADLLDLIDSLELKDFSAATAESSVEDKEGSILYRIPHRMEVEEEYRCVIRLAFDPESVVKNIDLNADTVVKDVRVSEVMEVDLIDPGATPKFAIRRLSSVEQFLEKNEYTEWIYFVKPLVTGQLPLVLKVAVKELINNRERVREIVLEETIIVVAEPAPDTEDAVFQSAGYSFSYSQAPQSGAGSSGQSQRRMAMLLVLGLVVASGIWATAVRLGWIPGPDFLLPARPDAADQAFWQKMDNEHSRSSYETYLKAYPNGIHLLDAHRKIDSLRAIELQRIDSLNRTPSATPETQDTVSVAPDLPAKATNRKKQSRQKPEPVKPASNLPEHPPAPVQPTNRNTPAPVTTLPDNSRNRKSGFDMVPVQGGKYYGKLSGCGTLANPDIRDFKIGKYEITQSDWKEIMGTSPSYHGNCPECPVERVSWTDIQRFILLANQKRHKKYRLPSEVEWEYAARGGRNNHGQKYAGSNDPNSVAWFNIIQERTHEVGLKHGNEIGLFDMSGNVWEWCAEPYPPYWNCAPESGSKKPLRGGSWADKRDEVTVSARKTEKAGHTDRSSGLRLIED